MSKLAQQLIEKEKIEQTGRLDLRYCGLTDLDAQVPELFDLVWLKKLTLKNYDNRRWLDTDRAEDGKKNKLDHISKNFKRLSLLECLHIGGVYFKRWNIRKLENLPQTLQELHIGGNQLSKLENLPQSLHTLYITGNQLSKLENLPQTLQELHIGGNQITKIENLPQNIRTLDIRNNQITILENLPQALRKLDIGDNQISDLKALLPFIIRGIDCTIFNNPIKSPSVDAVVRGRETFINYYKQLEEKEGKQ